MSSTTGSGSGSVVTGSTTVQWAVQITATRSPNTSSTVSLTIKTQYYCPGTTTQKWSYYVSFSDTGTSTSTSIINSSGTSWTGYKPTSGQYSKTLDVTWTTVSSRKVHLHVLKNDSQVEYTDVSMDMPTYAEPYTHSCTMYTNGGTLVMDGSTYSSYHTHTWTSYDVTGYIAPSSYSISRSGYVFQGWSINSGWQPGQSVTFGPSESIGVQTSLTLYACWVQNTYTHSCTMYTNGGTLVMDGSTYSSYHTHSWTDYDVTGRIGYSSYSISRSGYEFQGWSTNSSWQPGQSVTFPVGYDITLQTSLTVYACWIQNTYTHSCTMYTNDGTLVMGGNVYYTYHTESWTDYDVTGRIGPSSYSISRSGYEFQGWSINSGWQPGQSVTFPVGYDITLQTSLTVYACWVLIPTYTYYINYYDTDYSYLGQDSYGPTYDTSAYVTITITNPSKSGWTFVGWKDAVGNMYYRGDSIRITSSSTVVSLYAVFSTTYVLNLDPNGGSLPSGFSGQLVHTNVLTTSDNFSILSSYTPTRNNYTCYGWANSSSGSKVYNVIDTVNVARSESPKTIYACWFCTNEGLLVQVDSGTSSSLTITYTATYARSYDRYIYVVLNGTEQSTMYTLSSGLTTKTITLTGLSSDSEYTIGAKMYAYDPTSSKVLVGTTASSATGFTNLTYNWTYAYGQTTGTRKVKGKAFRLTAAEWNGFMNKLKTKYNRRTRSSMSCTTAVDGNNVTAGIYNEASSVLQDFGAPSSSVPTVGTGDPVTANCLNYLLDYLNTDDN